MKCIRLHGKYKFLVPKLRPQHKAACSEVDPGRRVKLCIGNHRAPLNGIYLELYIIYLNLEKSDLGFIWHLGCFSSVSDFCACNFRVFVTKILYLCTGVDQITCIKKQYQAFQVKPN